MLSLCFQIVRLLLAFPCRWFNKAMISFLDARPDQDITMLSFTFNGSNNFSNSWSCLSLIGFGRYRVEVLHDGKRHYFDVHLQKEQINLWRFAVDL
ncbi:MAG: hypothetical protein RMK18_10510 [Armatimonadota bacterium]|nr:hypothetical protein [Armatimonadota bacterium]MDW8026277.1 hypothetical protein [Armatimonadota bacterium]